MLHNRQSRIHTRRPRPPARHLLARDIMTPEPVTIDSATSVADAVHLMSVIKIRHVPIVHGKTLVGIVSDRDLLGFAADATFAERSVSSVMSERVFSVEPSTPLQTVADMMIEHHVGALAVVEASGAIAGIVSYVDVLRALKLCLP